MKSISPYLALLGLAAALAAQDSRAGTGTRTGQPDEIDRLCDDLVQPGPEAKARRLVAVERLSGSKDLRAHEALAAALKDGEEADTIARTLVVKLANPGDPVFGWNANASGRARVLKLYSDFAIATLASATTEAPALRARAILLALRPAERLELFRVHFALRDEARAARALMVAAECRDLGLAKDILRTGKERPGLATAARDALKRLWFAPELSTLADAEARCMSLEGKTYLDLAEQAARSKSLGGEADALRRELIATRRALLELALAAPSVDWVAIQRLVLGEGGVALTQVDPTDALAWLRAALVKSDQPPGEPAARAPFVQTLLAQSEGAPVPRAALMLECAALLVTSAEAGSARDELETALLQRLFAALASDAVRLREAALAGLERHPNPQSRARVVQSLRDGLARHDVALASAALRTLASKGYAAPQDPPESVAWLAALQEALRSQELDAKTRSQALAALGQRDSEGNGAKVAFQTLGDLARDAALEPWLRQQALAHFAGLAHTQAELDTVSERLVQALTDSDARVRGQAAELLGKLPAEAWRQETATALRVRLVVEPDRDVLAALLVCTKQRSSQGGDPEPVVRMLQLAIEELGSGAASRASDPLAAERKPALANALTTVAATQGVPPLLWARAAQTLLQAGERDRTRIVLDRQLAATTQELSADVRILIGKLVVDTALRKPREVPWSTLVPEATQVAQALETLETLQFDVQTPALLLLRLETLTAANRASEAAVLLRRLLLGSGSPTSPTTQRTTLPPDAAAIAVAVAEALRVSGDATGALGLCAELKPLCVGSPSAHTLTFTCLAAALVLEPARAKDLREELVSLLATVRGDPAHRELTQRIEDLLKKAR